MGALTQPRYMTIEEFDALPEDEEREFELFEGELQNRLCRLLEAAAAGHGVVRMEVPFIIHERTRQTKRSADVAFLSRERHLTAMEERWVAGAPSIVIEVLSPSNTASKMNRLERLCLDNGCQEFWMVDPETRTVKVRRRGDTVHVYEIDDSIPLTGFGQGNLAVSAIFEGIC